MTAATQFDQVSIVKRANVYFDGKCVSHTVLFPDGSRKTLGVILPGTLNFGTDAPELMEVQAGQCRIRQSCFPTSSATGKCMTKNATAMPPQAATGFTPHTALVTQSFRRFHLLLQALAQCSAQNVR